MTRSCEHPSEGTSVEFEERLGSKDGEIVGKGVKGVDSDRVSRSFELEQAQRAGTESIPRMETVGQKRFGCITIEFSMQPVKQFVVNLLDMPGEKVLNSTLRAFRELMVGAVPPFCDTPMFGKQTVIGAGHFRDSLAAEADLNDVSGLTDAKGPSERAAGDTAGDHDIEQLGMYRTSEHAVRRLAHVGTYEVSRLSSSLSVFHVSLSDLNSTGTAIVAQTVRLPHCTRGEDGAGNERNSKTAQLENCSRSQTMSLAKALGCRSHEQINGVVVASRPSRRTDQAC